MDKPTATLLPENAADAGANTEPLVDWMAEWDASAPLAVPNVSDAELELSHYLRVQNAIDAEMDRLEVNFIEMTKQLAAKKEWFQRQYGARAEMACKSLLRGKSKSVKTLYGMAGFRTVKPLLVVEDEVAIIDNAEAGQLPGNIVRVKLTTTIDKQALNQLYEETGEVPVGCSLRPQEERFYIK